MVVGIGFVLNPSKGPGSLSQSHRRRFTPTAVSQVKLEGTHVKAAQHWSKLKDPCHIWAVGNKSVRVKNDYEAVSLEDYMRLPVSQYYVLDPRLITSKGADSFEFDVPKLEFFNEWIQPHVLANVVQTDKEVHIKTIEASIRVSDLIASLDLDERWCMVFAATLQWENDTEAADKQLKGFQRALLNGYGNAKRTGIMHGTSRVDAWSEVATEFKFMQGPILQNACNLALNTLMQSLLPIFMNQLSQDFEKWASDESYRNERKTWDLSRFD